MIAKTRDTVIFSLNGQVTKVGGDDAFMTLAEWLRKRALLTGTKIVCAEGDCGACTVVRGFEPRNSKKKPVFAAMNSCITAVAQMDGSHLVTVEGLKADGELAPAQEAMRACHGSQCGYCTPGFVMAITGALEVLPNLDRKTAANYLTGNLCRCTGYSPILDAAQSVVRSPKHSLAARYLSPTIVKQLRDLTNIPLEVRGSLLGSSHLGSKTNTTAENNRPVFYAPTTLLEACKAAAKNKNARLVAAATDVGVQVNKGKALAPFIISLQHLAELYTVLSKGTSLLVGARVNLTQLRSAVAKSIPEFAKFLDIFASPQIKNVATLVGNLANASPIGDTLPFLLATNAVVHTARYAQGKINRRKISIQDFFIAYKKLALASGEIITAVEIPTGKPFRNLRLYKVSQRKDLDISAVSAALNIDVSTSGKISAASLAFGGVAATPIRLGKVERFLIGKAPSHELFDAARAMIDSQLMPLSDARGSDIYRRVLIANIFQRYVHTTLGTPAGASSLGPCRLTDELINSDASSGPANTQKAFTSRIATGGPS